MLDKESLSSEIYAKVNNWFKEEPQRPIGQFMIETILAYVEPSIEARNRQLEDEMPEMVERGIRAYAGLRVLRPSPSVIVNAVLRAALKMEGE